MVTAPIIAKSVAAIGALGAVTGGGWYYWNDLKEFWNSNNQHFLVKSTKKTDNFLTSNRCFSSDASREKAHCQIAKASFDNKKYIDQTSINLNKTWKKITEKEEVTIEKDSFYKLTIDVARFDKEIVFDSTSVHLKSSKGNVFAEFTIVASLNKKEPKANRTHFLVKAEKPAASTVSISSEVTKCTLNNAVETVACKVYKFTNNQGEDFSFETTAAADNVRVKKGDYFIVDFSGISVDDKNKVKKDASISKITWFKDDTTDANEKTEFSIISKLVGKFDSTNNTAHEIYALKNIPKKISAPSQEASVS